MQIASPRANMNYSVPACFHQLLVGRTFKILFNNPIIVFTLQVSGAYSMVYLLFDGFMGSIIISVDLWNLLLMKISINYGNLHM